MTYRPIRAAFWCLALALAPTAGMAQAQSGQSVPVPSRGQLLYGIHCVECHTAQMHWRAQRQARDWGTLRAQVTRWQGTASLGWSAADIDEVTRHLNDTIYQYPMPQQKASR